MSIQLHWFLPTYGDSRLIVGGGHGMPAGAAHGAEGGDVRAPRALHRSESEGQRRMLALHERHRRTGIWSGTPPPRHGQL